MSKSLKYKKKAIYWSRSSVNKKAFFAGGGNKNI
jgi:hypothetical protein